jgi:hypothetical protein
MSNNRESDYAQIIVEDFLNAFLKITFSFLNKKKL